MPRIITGGARGGPEARRSGGEPHDAHRHRPGRDENRGHRARGGWPGGGRRGASRRRATTTTARCGPSPGSWRRLETRRAARAARSASACPATISPATGLVKNANSVWLNGQSAAAGPRARAGPPRPAGERRQLLRAVGGHATARRRARRSSSASSSARAPAAASSCGGQVLTGPNAVAGEWGHNPLPWPEPDEWPGAAVLLRPARLHRDVPVGAGPGARSRTRDRRADAQRGDRRACGRRGRAGRGGAAAVRGADGAGAGEHHQRARSRRHRARRRVVEAGPPVRPACPRSGARGCSRTASTRGWCRRATATPAACEARRGSGPQRDPDADACFAR